MTLPKPTAHEALIYLMVVTSASDREMNDAELAHIGDSVRTWPIFLDYDPNDLVQAARDCQTLLQEDGGLDKVFEFVLESVPLHMHDTAYAAAVEVAVIDREMRMEERRVLERLRSWLAIDADTARAIEISAKARHRTLT
jgi:tellurite resistance protein